MKTILQTGEFREWLAALRDREAGAMIARRIRKMERGLMGDVKPVGQGVSEARVHHGPGYRLYLVQQGDIVIVLLCGGDKGSQDRDIARAKVLATTI